jgi:hypothetical protein
MSETGGTGDGRPHDPVGSVAEEAAKLLGALSGWARTHGSEAGHNVADAATAAFHEIDEHIATGSAECRYCPVCRVVHVVRECSPEVRTHLALAGANLMQAVAALMATATADDQRGKGGVERIDLDDAGDDTNWDGDDEWPEGE